MLKHKNGLLLHAHTYDLLMQAIEDDVKALISAGSTGYSIVMAIRERLVGDTDEHPFLDGKTYKLYALKLCSTYSSLCE